MYKITQQQKRDLKKLERWGSTSNQVSEEDWTKLAEYLGWIGHDRRADLFRSDYEATLCIKTSYTETERVVFNRVRKLYLSR